MRAECTEVQSALAKGKYHYDKREAIVHKTSRRDIERALKSSHSLICGG